MLRSSKNADQRKQWWYRVAGYSAVAPDSANTDRCTLYEDSANFLKDERFTTTEYQTSANL